MGWIERRNENFTEELAARFSDVVIITVQRNTVFRDSDFAIVVKEQVGTNFHESTLLW